MFFVLCPSPIVFGLLVLARTRRGFGSVSVSGQLPTYPSPNPTTVNVGLGEGVGGQLPRY